MSKFKKGDRVRRVHYDHRAHDVVVGQTGTVLSPHEGTPSVQWDNGVRCNSFQENLELIETPNTMSTLNITKEKVLEAASKCSTAKATLQVLFPEAFEPEKPEPYEFADGDRLSSWQEETVPCLFIGDAMAPAGYRKKCLIIGKEYRMETQEHNGRTILTFYKK